MVVMEAVEEGLFPVSTEPISRVGSLSPSGVGRKECGRPLASNALCKALLMALIQLCISPSEGAWYTRVKWGVMISKQNLRSELRDSRTDAIRRSIGSMCKSSFCFQLLYSDNLP